MEAMAVGGRAAAAGLKVAASPEMVEEVEMALGYPEAREGADAAPD